MLLVVGSCASHQPIVGHSTEYAFGALSSKACLNLHNQMAEAEEMFPLFQLFSHKKY